MQNHYFDITHPLQPYTHSLAAMPGTVAPVNALRGEKPTAKTGFWPAEKNGKWEDIEDHRGMEGYLNGQPHTIEEYGPLPNGWSDNPPPLTTEELFDHLRGQRGARISAVLWLRERHLDEQTLSLPTTLTGTQYTALLAYLQALRDLPAQPGAPFDGGGELTPWPHMPEV